MHEVIFTKIPKYQFSPSLSMKGEIFVINDHVQISQGAETWFINVVDNSVICDAMEVV